MTIEESKNIVAVQHGFCNWDKLFLGLIYSCSGYQIIKSHENEAALLHTKHHVEQALKAASENAEAITLDGWDCKIKPDTILNAYSIENIQ